jgi:hypothetical protein
MTSPKKIAANRNNATKSTGPTTAHGKRRARTNALRHGLAALTQPDHATSAEIERLARWICGEGASPSQYAHAHAIAKEQIMLRQVDTAYVAIIERANMIERASNLVHGGANQRPAGAPPPAMPKELEALRLALPQLARLDRYMQRALSRRARAMRDFIAVSVLRGAVKAERSDGHN